MQSSTQTAVYIPTEVDIRDSHIRELLRELSLKTYADLHRWSVENRADYWALVLKKLGIRFAVQPKNFWSEKTQTWFDGAELNISESCFFAPPEKIAIIEMSEARPRREITYAELQSKVEAVAFSAKKCGLKVGESVAICMPLHTDAVAIYLGLVWAGLQVVSIAESFSPPEIQSRLRLSKAQAIFCQDKMLRGGRLLELFEKIQEAQAPRAILIPFDESAPPRLRDGDVLWKDFLTLPPSRVSPVMRKAEDTSNILFSSGTTGDPKVIPWSHSTPIKSAADAYFHHDVKTSDVVTWPTSLGWMMGPWLIYATLLNKATLALFDGAPTGKEFGLFVEATGVTILGVVPSLVKTWRASGCMESFNWKKIKAFSSTGECSNASDMSYLMGLAGNRPVIEYCGGTEIGGAYLTSTLVEEVPASTFTTPTLGLDIVILNDERKPADSGEVYLIPPSVGLSTRLLSGGDHEKIYFANTPRGPHGERLRRHGDEIEKLPNGNYRALGRSDDTMNLGGIKVSSAEIERTLMGSPGIVETAAIAMNPKEGGPSLLVVYAVGTEAGDTMTLLQEKIKKELNPLFRIHDVVFIDKLPRTASNKVMRRELRKTYLMRQKN